VDRFAPQSGQVDDGRMPSSSDTYLHGHHDSVLRSHRWRTAENSAGYLLPRLAPEHAVVMAMQVGVGARWHAPIIHLSTLWSKSVHYVDMAAGQPRTALTPARASASSRSPCQVSGGALGSRA